MIYANNGSGSFSNVSAAAVGGYLGNLRQVAVGDVNGDGLPDIYAPQGDGSAPVLFMNQGSLVFADQAATRLPATYPAGAAARMGDVDNDGDLDIVAGDGYADSGPPFARLYLNDGGGVFSEAIGSLPASISGIDVSDIELVDVDRDFDLDLVLSAHSGGIGAHWLNDGTGAFSAGGSLAPPASGSFHYNVTPCDVDGDGDLDLWFDNIGGGLTEQLQINDGSGSFSDETALRVTGNPATDDNGVACADVDNDGDLDAVVISLGTPERLLQNDGTGRFTYVPGVFPAPTDCSLWGEFGDLDGDGRLDLVTGQGECSSSDEVYLGSILVPIDTQPPRILAVEDPGLVPADRMPVLRFAVQDASVADAGPHLDRAFVLIDPDGAALEIDADFIGGDLFRAALPLAAGGPVSFRACAVDREGNQGCSATLQYAVDPLPEALFGDGFEGP